ncbi:MAG: ACP S-malonyltransferase [Vallitaleaceae bacterium]|nr:ACP S-malonyltransferase [Vallitaleaceae bacterium]
MGKIGFIFPGQGAQSVGMGKDIIEKNEKSKAIYDKANALLDFDLEAICFTDNDLINQTNYTQPALLTTSVALLEAIKDQGIIPDMVAGLSLGEYAALVANGAITFEDAIVLVRKRGEYMEAAAQASEGGMAAIIGSDEETIKGIIDSVDGYLGIANYNNPKQIVISGEIKSLNKAVELFTEKGIKAIPLKVSGAFHSQLMKPAADALALALEDITVKPFTTAYYTNVTGQVVMDRKQVKSLLVDQVVGSVRWEENVVNMIAAGVDLFIEIGPGQTLKGLIKKIDRKAKVINVYDQETLDNLIIYMEERS